MSFDAERLIRLQRVAAVAPHPDGAWIAVQVERLSVDGARYVSDLWRVPLDGGAAVQLTRGEKSDRSPAFAADGGLCFLSDRASGPDDSAPKTQVWRLAPEGGEPAPITDEPLGVSAFQLGVGVVAVLARRWPGIAEDAQRAHQDDPARPRLHRYRARPVRFWDHWSSNARLHLRVYRDGAITDLTPDGLADAEAPAWSLSADGRRVVLGTTRRGSDGIIDRDLRVIELADGSARCLTGGDRVELEQPRLSPDGRWLVCVRNGRAGGPGFRPRVDRFDLDAATPTPVRLAEGWDVVPRLARFVAPDSLLVNADLDGDVTVWRLELDGSRVRLTAGGSYTDPHLVDGRLVCIRSGLTQPPEPHHADRPLARLSGWRPEDAAAIEWTRITCPGAHGDPVSGFFVEAADATAPRPLLLWIHGGPMGAYADGWHWRWNACLAAQQGFAVALPNPRGSTGYGEQFMNAVWGDNWGGACYDDLMAFADACAARPGVDATRQVAMGGSFGGYMCNWIGTRTTRFKALVSHAGLTHFPQFRLTTDDGDWFAWGLGCDGRADLGAAQCTYSPHTGLDAYRTPTLIVHGEKDYRVPIGEALALFDGLQRRGVESELLVFPDENHWILKPPHVVAWNTAWVEFMRRYV